MNSTKMKNIQSQNKGKPKPTKRMIMMQIQNKMMLITMMK